MKVASLFGKKASRKEAESFIKPTKDVKIDISIGSEIAPQEEIFPKAKIAKKEGEKPKYIFAAISKAEERKYIQEEVKNKRLERKFAEWEKEHGPLLKFDTLNGTETETTDENENEQNENIENGGETDEKGEKKSNIPTDDEFEEMKERYMKRLEETTILQFPTGKKAQIELLYYPEICGIPIIAE